MLNLQFTRTKFRLLAASPNGSTVLLWKKSVRLISNWDGQQGDLSPHPPTPPTPRIKCSNTTILPLPQS